jgi:hypothetical protein
MYIFSKPYSTYPRTRKIESTIPESEGMRIFVYQLRDDGSNIPFYVGKGMGNRPIIHFANHVLEKDQGAKSRHIRKMLEQNKEIHIDIIKFFDNQKDAYDFEQTIIAQYGKKFDGTGILYNLTDGGDCGPTFENHKQYINKQGIIKWFKEDPQGDWEPYSNKGKICIEYLHNGHKTFIDKEDFDPLVHRKSGTLTGYRVYSDGNTLIKLPKDQEPPEGFYPSSAITGKVRVTDGIVDMFIDKDAAIPEGFSKGISPYKKTTKGTVPLTNGTDNIIIKKGDPIPEGYYHRNKGQVYITDGIIKRKLREGQDIPEGWWIGSNRINMHMITDGTKRKWVFKSIPLPSGWSLVKK